MLKDAALLQLDLLLASLEQDMVLKDSTPYNVQFKGARPVFVDVGSFERIREGEPWVGYRQFCMLYLYPLLLQAVKDVPFQPWMRGSIDGITPSQMRNLMSFRDRFRRGMFTQRLPARPARGDVRRQAGRGQAGGQPRLQEGAVRRQRAQDAQAGRAARLGPARGRLDRLRRAQQLHRRRRPAQGRVRAPGRHARSAWGLVWDIGANNGRYSRIAAEGAKTVVAVDADQGPVELLYRDLRKEGNEQILHARDEPGRPVARPRLARAGAQVDARPRQARPGARARAGAPRRDQRATCRSRSSSTGSPRSAPRW